MTVTGGYAFPVVRSESLWRLIIPKLLTFHVRHVCVKVISNAFTSPSVRCPITDIISHLSVPSSLRGMAM